MKEHGYFLGSCSVLVIQNTLCPRSALVRKNQQNFCSCSVLAREQVLEQINVIFSKTVKIGSTNSLCYVLKNIRVLSSLMLMTYFE